MHARTFIVVCLLLASSLAQILPVLAQPALPEIHVRCDKPIYYVKGDTIQAQAFSNVTVDVTLRVYWNWRSFADNDLVYQNTKITNATWNIPTTNAKPGFYKLVFTAPNFTAIMWRTLLHLESWIPDSLPFSTVWKGINYTLQGKAIIARKGSNYLAVNYPRIPFLYDTAFYRNNMSFLVRVSGGTWAVDVLYFLTHQGVKWRLNGTLDNPQTFEFTCVQNPLVNWQKQLHRFASTTGLIFDWDDLKKAGKAFTWNAATSTVSVTIPDSFDLDPVFTEDFEGGRPEYGAWDLWAVAGSATCNYSSTWSHHGVNSSRVNSSNTGASRSAYARKDESESQLNVRWYFYIEQIGASSAFAYFLRMVAGGWRQFCLGINTANNNVTVVWYNGSTSYTEVLDTVWNTSEVYLLETQFIRHASNASWTIFLNEEILFHDDGLGNDWDTDNLFFGHYSNFRSGWTVTYYDCLVMDTSYIGPDAVEPQEYTWTPTASVAVIDTSSVLGAFDQSTLHSITTSGAGLDWYELRAYFMETVSVTSWMGEGIEKLIVATTTTAIVAAGSLWRELFNLFSSLTAVDDTMVSLGEWGTAQSALSVLTTVGAAGRELLVTALESISISTSLLTWLELLGLQEYTITRWALVEATGQFASWMARSLTISEAISVSTSLFTWIEIIVLEHTTTHWEIIGTTATMFRTIEVVAVAVYLAPIFEMVIAFITSLFTMTNFLWKRSYLWGYLTFLCFAVTGMLWLLIEPAVYGISMLFFGIGLIFLIVSMVMQLEFRRAQQYGEIDEDV